MCGLTAPLNGFQTNSTRNHSRCFSVVVFKIRGCSVPLTSSRTPSRTRSARPKFRFFSFSHNSFFLFFCWGSLRCNLVVVHFGLSGCRVTPQRPFFCCFLCHLVLNVLQCLVGDGFRRRFVESVAANIAWSTSSIVAVASQSVKCQRQPAAAVREGASPTGRVREFDSMCRPCAGEQNPRRRCSCQPSPHRINRIEIFPLPAVRAQVGENGKLLVPNSAPGKTSLAPRCGWQRVAVACVEDDFKTHRLLLTMASAERALMQSQAGPLASLPFVAFLPHLQVRPVWFPTVPHPPSSSLHLPFTCPLATAGMAVLLTTLATTPQPVPWQGFWEERVSVGERGCAGLEEGGARVRTNVMVRDKDLAQRPSRHRHNVCIRPQT